MKTLDKSRHYAEIFHSEKSDGSRYEQDGVTFDAHGKQWTPPEPAPEGAPDLAHPSVQAAIDAAVKAAVAAALATSAKAPASTTDKNLKG